MSPGEGSRASVARAGPSKASVGRRVAIGLVIVAVVGLGLAAAGFLSRNWILKLFLEAKIYRQTGLRARISNFETRVGEASVRIAGFQMLSPEEFGGEVLLDMPELFVEADPDVALEGSLRFREVRIHIKRLHVIKDAKGRSNLDSMLKLAADEPASLTAGQTNTIGKLAGYRFAGIQRLEVTFDTIQLTDLRQVSSRDGREILLRLGIQNQVFTDIKDADELRYKLTALVVSAVLRSALSESSGDGSGGLSRWWKALTGF